MNVFDSVSHECRVQLLFKMNLQMVFWVVCLSVFYTKAEMVNTWGDVHNFTLIASDRIYEKEHNNQILTRVVKYPKVITNYTLELLFFTLNRISIHFIIPQGWFARSKYYIRGIKHFDYDSGPSNTEIIKGGIGEKQIQFQIKSQPGHAIRSIVELYGEEISEIQNGKFYGV